MSSCAASLDHAFYGWIAAIGFGVSSVYQQAIVWFAASFSVLALDTILLALLAAQRWRQNRRRRWLLLSCLATALAPAWFASGILAGPLCALYLWPNESLGVDSRRVRLAALTPLLGSAVSWPSAYP